MAQPIRKRAVMPGDMTPFKRNYDPVAYKTSGSGSLDLFRDCLVAGFLIVIAGSYVASWSSGTPVADPRGPFNLIDSIKFAINWSGGSRDVIDTSPELLATKELLRYGKMPEVRSSAGSSATVNPVADGVGGLFGTTGQTTSFRAVIRASFKDILASGLLGESSVLDLRNAVSASVKFQFNNMPVLQRPDDTTVVTYSSVNINLTIDPIDEAHAALGGSAPYDLVQGYTTASFAAAGTQLIELPVGDSIRGLTLKVRNGDAARSPSDTAITVWKLKAGGRTIREGTFLNSQSENREHFAALNTPFSGGKSDSQGRVYLDFTKAGVTETGEDFSTVKQAYLELTAAAAGSDGATFSSAPVEVLVGWDVVQHKLPQAVA